MKTNLFMALGYFLGAYLYKNSISNHTDLDALAIALLVCLGLYRLAKVGEDV